MLRRISAAVLVSGVLIACSSSSRSGFDSSNGGNGGDNPGTGSLGNEPAPQEESVECQKMDIVFIVDDSGSMGEEQTNLASNFPKFVEILNDYKTKSGSDLDWRVAITTTGRDVTYNIVIPGSPGIPMTEKGDNGAFRNKASCGAKRRWVEKSDGNATSTFSCLAEVGTAGPSVEMPLESLKLSLEDRMSDGTNKGFLRPDALLAVVILTDEDDCSRSDNNFTVPVAATCSTTPGQKPVEEYADMLDTVTGDRKRWATAVIAGQSECTSSFGNAMEAVRLKDFVKLAGPNGAFSSICDGNLTTGLQKALATFDAACKSFSTVK